LIYNNIGLDVVMPAKAGIQYSLTSD